MRLGDAKQQDERESVSSPKLQEVQIAPNFPLAVEGKSVSLHELAARTGKLVLITLDSYRFHPG